MIGTDRSVLELGCWNGHVSGALVAAGNRVVGVDIDADELASNPHIERGHVVDLDVQRLSEIEHERFDVVMLGDVLEHLRRPDEVLRDLTGLLNDGGRFVISVPNVSHVDVRLHLLSGRWDYQDVGLLDRTHLRWFTRAGLRSLLDDAGLTATRVETVRHPMGASQLPLDDAYPADALRYVDADPDSSVYQFVVEAVPGDGADALGTVERQPIDFAVEQRVRDEQLAALHETNDALRHANESLSNEIDALKRSRAVRLSSSLRRLLRRGG
jgi:SAM-dependent methyltransferase